MVFLFILSLSLHEQYYVVRQGHSPGLYATLPTSRPADRVHPSPRRLQPREVGEGDPRRITQVHLRPQDPSRENQLHPWYVSFTVGFTGT